LTKVLLYHIRAFQTRTQAVRYLKFSLSQAILL